jgi:hypothetical protein
LVIGTILLAAGIVAALAWRSRSRESLPAAGLLIAASGALVLRQLGQPASGLVAGLCALSVAGLVADVVPRARIALPVLAVPGAWLLATSVEVEQPWAPWAIGIAVTIGGSLVAAFDGRPGARRLGPGLMAVSLVGVFITVPETREALPVLGAALPLVLLGWPSRLATLGAGGALASTGLLAWTVGQGGTFRDSAVVGGLACLGLLMAEPVGSRLLDAPPLTRQPPPWALTAILAVHGTVVLVVARVAGLRDDLGTAVVLAVVALLVGVGLSAAITAACTAGGSAPSGSPPRSSRMAQ